MKSFKSVTNYLAKPQKMITREKENVTKSLKKTFGGKMKRLRYPPYL